MKYTHVVIDDSLNNFKVGTEVFILLDASEYDTSVISDGKLIKMCLRSQLKLKEDFE